MNSYATKGKGVYPGWMQLQALDQNTADDGYLGTTAIDIEMSWAAKLLNSIDQQGLWDALLAGDVSYSQGILTGPDDIPQIALFICPSNASTTPGDPALTYVANTGVPDTAAPGSDVRANGMCHNLVTLPASQDYSGEPVRIGSDVPDGANTTMLLSENVHKDETDRSASPPIHSSWLRSSGFLISPTLITPDRGEQPFGMVWVYDTGSPLAPDPGLQQRLNRDERTTPSDLAKPFMSAGSVFMGGRFARPASQHPEMVLAVFAGGNTRSISEQIEYRVYQQLLTPNGRKAEFPGVTTPNEIQTMRDRFNQPPLSDSDY